VIVQPLIGRRVLYASVDEALAGQLLNAERRCYLAA
jgi:hypothetical protein